MNYINLSNSLIPLLHVCKLYSIPSDISYIIYNMLINRSAQIIINSWYNFIMIHNINLVDIISRLQLYMAYDTYGMPFYYYNLYDKKIGITFNICCKYFDFMCSDIDWWTQRITYAFNGLSIYNDINNVNFAYNFEAISNFHDILYV